MIPDGERSRVQLPEPQQLYGRYTGEVESGPDGSKAPFWAVIAPPAEASRARIVRFRFVDPNAPFLWQEWSFDQGEFPLPEEGSFGGVFFAVSLRQGYRYALRMEGHFVDLGLGATTIAGRLEICEEPEMRKAGSIRHCFVPRTGFVLVRNRDGMD
jgi:hypothetical protein